MRRRPTKAELQEKLDRIWWAESIVAHVELPLRRLDVLSLAELRTLNRGLARDPEKAMRALLDACREIEAACPAPGNVTPADAADAAEPAS